MAKTVRLTKWNGTKCLRAVESQETKRLKKAAIHFTNKAKQNISVKGSKCGKKTGNRSKPNEFPKLECGQLRNSMTYEVSKLKAVAGTNVKHGKFLELGTSRMAPRPFLRPTLKAERGRIRKIIAGKKLKGF